MSIRISLFFILCVIIFHSCRVQYTPTVYAPCTFDPTTLSVIGTDFDFKDSLVKKNQLIVLAIHYTGCLKSEAVRPNVYDWFEDRLSFRICHCKDMDWAKKQIYNEIKRRYPFEVHFTDEYIAVFDITLLDTCSLIPSLHEYTIHDIFDKERSEKFYEVWQKTKIEDGYKTIGHLAYDDILGMLRFMIGNSLEYDDIRIEITNKTRNNILPGYYDFKFLFEYLSGDFYPKYPYEDVRNYIQDSLGFKIERVHTYSKPIKKINFDLKDPRNAKQTPTPDKEYLYTKSDSLIIEKILSRRLNNK